jgi:uncharacterized protein YbaP (TraB family)
MTTAMRTPSRTSLAVLALVAFLGACKKDSPKTSTPADAAVAAKPADAGAGSTTPPPGDAAVAPTGKVKAFFYAVEKDGKTSHLLGTMHMGVDPARLPDNVYAALGKSKQFAMETNIMDPSLLSSLQRDDGKTLEDELGPDYWKKLETALGPQMANGLKNMKASTAAAVLELKGLPMTQPMDLVLLQKGKDAGAEVIYLEEAKLQQKLLDKWLDARALKMMLDEADKGDNKNQEMLSAYESGDETVVEKLTFDKEAWKQAGRDEKEFDQMLEELLLDRNASWIPAIEKMIAKGDAFIAVGAAHLIGKGSVLELLRAKGYTVNRVTN